MADLYSPQADNDLDKIEASDPDLYEAALVACDLVFRSTGKAQSLSAAIRTEQQGIVFRLPVAGMPPWKVFWRIDPPSNAPIVLAVLKHGS